MQPNGAAEAQLFRQFPNGVPCLHIEDWPDFPTRGVMIDISRDKVPTMATLYALVDLLASMKINQLQLYTEHTFAYRNHPEAWAEASPMTGEEILALDAYCRARFIQLVPNQNSFGHMERWLKLPRYARSGVAHIWLIDPPAHLLQVFRRQESTWTLVSTFADDAKHQPVDSVFDFAYYTQAIVEFDDQGRC